MMLLLDRLINLLLLLLRLLVRILSSLLRRWRFLIQVSVRRFVRRRRGQVVRLQNLGSMLRKLLPQWVQITRPLCVGEKTMQLVVVVKQSPRF
ncbi:P44 outer membrane protein, silent [Anaplasma phagocytophilum]|uniref:p44 outer membrane protein, silent n=1 Tax=Anaplasma phagocytophilum TaxID=948 RepID=A0A098EFQ2_ANAPH|nr:P44 outer membrane protein, silent [Anaplasma phagocytophilum]